MTPDDFIPTSQVLSRRPKSGLSLPDIPKEAYIIAVVIALLMVGIWGFSHPFGAEASIAQLEQQARVIKSASKAESDLTTYPIGNVCTGALDDTFKNRLTNALMNAGLKVDSMDVIAIGRTGESHPLMAYGFSLKGSGSYEQAMGGLDLLAHENPKLFLDSLIMRNQTASVDLSVEGRLYCRWTKQK